MGGGLWDMGNVWCQITNGARSIDGGKLGHLTYPPFEPDEAPSKHGITSLVRLDIIKIPTPARNQSVNHSLGNGRKVSKVLALAGSVLTASSGLESDR